MTYYIVVKDDKGKVVARGHGQNLEAAVDSLNNDFDIAALSEVISLLEKELDGQGS